MKALIAAALLLLGLPSLWAARDSVAQRALDAAMEQSAIFQDGVNPFLMEVDFTARFDTETHGHLTLRWMSRDAWWSKVVMGSFEQVMVKTGGKRYTSRNRNFTPVRIDDLTQLLMFKRPPETWIAGKQKQLVVNGTQLACIHGAPKDFEPHSVCINPSSHDILIDDWAEYPEDRHRAEFSGYADFEGHRYPRSLQLQVNGHQVIIASVNTLTAATFDPSLLTPPTGQYLRVRCDDGKPGELSPMPPFSSSNAQKPKANFVLVTLTIMPNGKVSDIQVTDTDGHPINDERLTNPQHWPGKPATCGRESVTTDFSFFYPW